MTTEQIVFISTSIIGSGTLASAVTLWFNRRKTSAETKNVNISGELKISDAWKEFGKEWKAAHDQLQNELERVKTNFLNERREWEKERKSLLATIKQWQAQHNEQVKANNKIAARIEKLEKTK